jgi:hypothetical protein
MSISLSINFNLHLQKKKGCSSRWTMPRRAFSRSLASSVRVKTPLRVLQSTEEEEEQCVLIFFFLSLVIIQGKIAKRQNVKM